MPSFVRAIDDALGTSVCVALRPFTTNPLSSFSTPDFQDFYRRNCNLEPPPPPPPPFSGGQCPGIPYIVLAFIANALPGSFGSDRNNAGFTTNNAVRSITTRLTGANDSQTLKFWQLVVTDIDGAEYVWGFTTNFNDDPGVGNIRISRVDGLPDTCGNPPPPPPPPFPIEVDPFEVTYDDDDGNPVTINFSPVVYAPVSVGNGWRIPVSLTYNNPVLNIPVRVRVNIRFDRDGDGNSRPVSDPETEGDRRPPTGDGDGDGSGRQPEDYSTPDYVPVNPDTQPDNEPEPPLDDCPATRPRPQNQVRVIRGVVVSVVNPGSRTSTIFPGSGGGLPIYAPGCGWIQFRVAINGFQTAWLSDIPVKNGRNVIPVPWEGGAVDWGFIPNGTDVQAVITPIFASQEVASRRDGETPRCGA